MPDEARIYRFGDVEVDTAAHRVVRGGRELALEPKAYSVLLALLEHPGHAIARDDLLDRVWGHRHVTPGVLNRVVAQLRKALGDEAEHPHYIQTLHAVGYRFMCAPEISVPQEAAEAEISPSMEGREISADAEAVVAAGEAADAADTDAAARLVAGERAPPWGWAPGLALLLVLLVAAVGWWWRGSDPALARTGAAVAVRPFSMLGGSEGDVWFAEGLALEMHDALAGVPGLEVAALMDGDDPRRSADVRELGRELAVDAILDASIRRDGDRLRISARLSDTRSGYVLWSRRYEHSMAELFATQGAIAGEVVESMLGAMPEQRESLRRRLAPTRSVAAFDAYLRGLYLARAPATPERSSQAAEAFRAALAEDAGFARAQAALCTTETARFEYWNDVDAHKRALAACARAADFEPAPPEAALALGNLERVGGDFDRAMAQFERAAADPGTAAMAQVGIAKVHAARGQAELAEEHFRQALALAPASARIRAEVGFQAYRDGRIDDAIGHYRESLALDPDNAGNWNTYGFLHMLRGDTGEAARAFERSIAIRPTADVLANLGTLRAWSGEHAASVPLYRRALELDPDDYVNWGLLGDGLRESGAPPGDVVETFSEAERRVRRYLAVDPGDGYALAALGWYCANLGKRDEALEKVGLARESGRGDPAEIALYNAETLALLGEREASRAEVARALREGLDEARIRASPVLQKAQAAVSSEGRG
ncbi:winged helix-turn-helix domain-containing protein [Luteimonas arsenica]|uniref:winged helix-turn-helix domain-containing protein n=1 Tax=Luteimonas arsenica TaxID=1586242 RepID=UPI0010560736|nr:winged helix-turn-helix domain-containing protein [Luteimonas arsenica]